MTAILVAVLALASSCRVESRPEMGAERANGTVLSQEETLAAAHVAAREHGYDPNGGFYLDIDNGEWMSFFVQPEIADGVAIWPEGEARVRMHDAGVERTWPDLARNLKGRDYQVAIYREWALDTGLYVLVDKRTAEILFVYPED